MNLNFRLMRGVSVLATVAGLVSATSLQSQKSAGDYWPMKTGTTWQLTVKTMGRTTVQDIQVTGVSNGVATLQYKMNGQEIQIEKYLVKPGSVSRIAAGPRGSGTLSPPLPIIHYPMKAGNNWKWKGIITTGGNQIPASAALTTFAPTVLKLKSGTFKATRVHMVLSLNQKGATMTIPNDYWFAPNVGLVQQNVNLMGNEVNAFLSSYKLKK